MNNQQGPSIRAAVPYTCGELFQGTLDGEPCLVSCPIDGYSTVKVLAEEPVVPHPIHAKARQALEYITTRSGKKICVSLDNPLPAGRGYGTSTADIGAVLFAASQALDIPLSASEAAQIAVQIEPTDSTFFPGLTLFDHRRASFSEFLGHAPSAGLVILDPGGGVDTEKFNAQDWRAALAAIASEHRCAFQLLRQGIASGDLLTIGAAATMSALCHQSILFNPWVEVALSLSKQLGAAGICRAHSGTIVGLLFPKRFDIDSAMTFISQHIPAPVQVWKTALVSGGPRIISDMVTNEESHAP